MTTTLRYAIIGNPVAHSKSPEIHAAFAAQAGMNLSYERLLAPPDGFRATVEDFRAHGGCGANVTLPFKLDAFTYATEVSNRARDAGAVNTLTFDATQVFGDNTDGVGLVKDLRGNLRCAIAGKRVLIAGAGGAARGVIGPLLAEAPSVIAIANRTFSKAEEIAQLYTPVGNIIAIALADVPGHQFDIVINATAASLKNDLPIIPRSVFAEGSLAYDMMYGKGLTPFLARGRQAGASVADGLGMLVEQAAESFLIWHGIRPKTEAVFRQLRLSAPLN
jgi:shikimate dehydrogenase